MHTYTDPHFAETYCSLSHISSYHDCRMGIMGVHLPEGFKFVATWEEDYA